MTFFACENLTMRFGGLTAVNDFNLSVEEGEIVGLIGPNGAGKTTVFNMIAGYYRPSWGVIYLEGQRIDGMKANRVNRLGIARTFQNIRLFPELSVLENVLVAHHGRLKSSFFEAMLRTPRYRKEEEEMYGRAEHFLAEVGLSDVAHERSGALPYGKQRRLEIAPRPGDKTETSSARRTGRRYEPQRDRRTPGSPSEAERGVRTDPPHHRT